jgi:membrane protease YdiL (CAAX protease family)
VDSQLRFWLIGGGCAWAVLAVALFRKVVPPVVESRVLTRISGARALVGAMIGVVLLALLLGATARLDPLPRLAVSLAVHAGLAVFLVALARTVDPGNDALGLGVARLPEDFARGLGAYVVFIPTVVAAHVLNAWLVGDDADSVQKTVHEALGQDGPGRMVLILNLVLAVPLFEELVFRGLLQQGVKAQLALVAPPGQARVVSIVLASVAFTALHPPATYIPVFALSLLLGAAYEKSGRLLVPVALHAAHNLAVVLYDSLPQSWGAAP